MTVQIGYVFRRSSAFACQENQNAAESCAGVGTDLGRTASLSRPYLHEGMVLQFLQYGGMDRESEAVFRMRIDARNGANADDLCRWLQGYSPVFRP